MKGKQRRSRHRRNVKAVKRLARRMRVPPTRVQESKRKPRKRPRTLEEHLKDEGWL